MVRSCLSEVQGKVQRTAWIKQEDGWFGKEVYICYIEDEDAYYIESERNDIHVLFQEPEETANE